MFWNLALDLLVAEIEDVQTALFVSQCFSANKCVLSHCVIFPQRTYFLVIFDVFGYKIEYVQTTLLVSQYSSCNGSVLSHCVIRTQKNLVFVSQCSSGNESVLSREVIFAKRTYFLSYIRYVCYKIKNVQTTVFVS